MNILWEVCSTFRFRMFWNIHSLYSNINRYFPYFYYCWCDSSVFKILFRLIFWRQSVIFMFLHYWAIAQWQNSILNCINQSSCRYIPSALALGSFLSRRASSSTTKWMISAHRISPITSEYHPVRSTLSHRANAPYPPCPPPSSATPKLVVFVWWLVLLVVLQLQHLPQM